MNNAVIIAKNPGFEVPQQFFKLISKNHKSAIGYAVRVTQDDKSRLVTANEEGIPTEAEFLEMMQEQKDFPAIYWLAHFDGKVNPNDIQPFVLTTDEKEDYVSYFIEGSFDAFENKDTSAAYKLSQDIVMPHLSDIYGLVDGNPEKFEERLGGALSKQLLTGTIGKRGIFAFLPAEGNPVIIGNNELGAEYEWGNVSQHHGYKEGPGIVEQAVQSVKKRFSIFKEGDAATEDKPSASQQLKVDNPNTGKETLSLPEQSSTTTSTPSASTAQKAGGHYEKIPGGLHGKKRKQWLRKTLGLQPSDALPSGHEQLTEVWVNDLPGGPVKDLKEVGKVIDMKAAAPKPVPTKGSEVAAARADNASTSSTGTAAKSGAISGTSALIEPANAGKAQEWLLKNFHDRSSQAIPDPKMMQENEAKYPSFSDKVDKLENTFRIPADMLWDFQQENPKATHLMLLEYRRAYISLLEQHGMLPGAKAEKEDTTAKVEAAPVKAAGKSTVREKAPSSVPSSPVQAAAPEPTPAKKAGFFSRMAG